MESDLLSEIVKKVLEIDHRDKKTEREFIQIVMQYKEVIGNIPCNVVKKKRKPGRPRKEVQNAATEEYKIKEKKSPNKEYQDLLSLMLRQKGNGAGHESD